MSEILKTALYIGLPIIGLIALFLLIRHGDMKRARAMVESVRKNLSDYYKAKEYIQKKADEKKAEIDKEPVDPFTIENVDKYLEEPEDWKPKD